MFWKKKKIKNDLPLFEYEDQRASFRYVFKKMNPFFIYFKNQKVRVLDISAGGLAFENKDFSKYDEDQVSLNLEMPNFLGDPVLNARVRILHLTRNNICHSIFENCSVDEYEMIHKYVLEMQKLDLIQG